MAQKRILLIDDDRACLKVLRDRLEEAGYETMTATDGPQGLALARSKSPDLIVLELLLPGLDGFQICQLLKQDAHYSHIPLVILTGVFVAPEDMQQGLQLGDERYILQADAYFAKPPVYERLLQEIRVLLGEVAPPLFPSESLILVVDDDGLHRAFLRQTLSEVGYPAVVAADGEEGWSCFQSSAPSLVLLDARVPGPDGREAVEWIRGQDADVAVIVMTALDSEESGIRAVERGADDYIIKPFQPWQIAHAVWGNLEKARLRRLNRQLAARLRDSNLHLVQKHRALQDQNTALQEAYQHLLEMERLRQSMISMVVHDLKNPLNVVILSVDLFAADFGDMLSEVQRDILRSTNLATQRMLHLITNLLEVHRLEEGKMPVHLQPLEMALVLRVMVRQSQPLADQKNVALLLEIPDTLPWVLGDVDLLPRVVANLLDNAIKFTPADGQITVTTEPTEETLVVCVADTGPGIPTNQQARIFDKFAQLDQDPGRGDASVGLGLAFCKLAIEAQGGRIWVESDLGQGSRFKFALPFWQEDFDFDREDVM
jgi:two-component system sensor histidine kinase/response regulator